MSLKSTIGKLLPIAAAGLALLFPAAAPIIVGAAGVVGAYLASDGFSMGDWGAQAKDADLIQANFKSTQKTIPVVYGKRRVGSNDVFVEISGENDERILWIVSCLSEGECDSIAIDPSTGQEQIYIDNITVEDFNQKHGENNGVEDIVKYHFHSGTHTQTVDPSINAAIPRFTDTLRNTCYVVWEIKWVKGLFAGMPVRQVVLNGLKVHDIRTGVTSFSKNPALHLHDFLTNERYGLSFSPYMMDQDSFRSAATYCEGGTSHPAWEVNYVIASQIRSQTVLDTLLAHFRGMLTWYDGRLYLKFAQLDLEPAVGSIVDSDIARDEQGYDLITISQPSSFMIPDSALIKYVSEHKNWTLDDVYIGDKLGHVVQYEFPGFTEVNLARAMGVYMLERSQLNRTYSMTLRASNIVYEPNDVVTITSSEAGLDSTTCRVVQSDITQDGMINLSVVVEDESLYNKVYDLDPDEVYKVNLADPAEAPPSVQWITFGEQIYSYRDRSFVRLNIQFGEPTKTPEGLDYPWFDYAEVHVSYDGINYEFLFNAPDDFQIDPVGEGSIWIALVSVSAYGQKQAFENALKAHHRVLGISEIKPTSELYATVTVTGDTVAIYAPLRRDPDIEGYEVRLGNSWYSNTWYDALLLSVTANPTVSFSPVSTGSHTMWLDVKGKNGLYSGNPIGIDFVIQSPPIGYVDQNVSGPIEPIDIPYSGSSHYGTIEKPLGTHGIALQVNRAYGGGESNLEGYYISDTIELDMPEVEEDKPMIISVDAGTALIGGGTTWSSLAPSGNTTTWNDIYPAGETRTWKEIGVRSDAAARIGIEAEISYTGSSWTRVFGLEKLTATVYQPKYMRFTFRLKDVQKSGFYTIGPARVHVYKLAPQLSYIVGERGTRGISSVWGLLTTEEPA